MKISCVLYVDFDVNEHRPTKFYAPFTNPYMGVIETVSPPVEEATLLHFHQHYYMSARHVNQ